MKKFILLLLVISLTSCSNNDSNNSDATLAGVWKLTSLTVDTPILINGVATTNLTDMAADSQINFTSNTSGRINYVTDLAYFSHTVNQNIEYSSTSSMVSVLFSFVKSNNVVTMINADNESMIATLNNTTLTLENEDGIVVGNLDSNTNDFHKITYVFTKQ